MKTLTILMIVCTIGVYSSTLTDEQKSYLYEFKKSCFTEIGTNETDSLEHIGKGGPMPEADEKLHCFFACLLKKIGIIQPDGTIDVKTSHARAAASNVDITKADSVIEKCKNIKGKDLCDVGGQIVSCLFMNKDFPLLN